MPDVTHATQTSLRLKGVGKKLGGQPVLSNLDLSIGQGEKVVLLGASGCGKSTLLRCLNGLMRVDEGLLEVLGYRLDQQVRGFDIHAFRARVALVFQQYNLFPHCTVLENITLGPVHIQNRPHEAVRTDALALLDRVGIGDKANALPGALSGGQQQRVAIARALAMQPEILLLDEPTSALDPLMTGEVLQVIEDTLSERNTTLVMVTHEVGFARRVADRIVFLDAGRVISDTSNDQFFNDSPLPSVVSQYLSAVRSNHAA